MDVCVSNQVPAVTAVFADLVSWLLDSDPLQRMTWSDAPSHPFWAPKVCSRPTNLPSQPAFEAYLKRLEELEAAREAHQYEAKRDGAGKSIIDVPVIASQSSQASQQSPSPVPSTVSIVAASPAKTVPATPSRVDRETATVAASAGSLLMCAHDSQVRPIVNNRAIEVIERPPFKASALPCAPITIQQVSGMLPTELEAHLTKIYKALHKAMAGCVANCEVVAGPASAAQAQQQQVQIYADKMGSLLGYLCSLAPSPDIANVVMNTQFLKVLLRILLLVVSRYRHVQSAALAGTPNSRIPGHSPVGKPSTVGRPSAVSAVQLAISATVTESACLAATVLALMLRHATFVQTVQSTKTDNEIGTPDKRSRFASSPSSPSGQQSAGLDGTHVDSPNIVNALINTMHVVDAEISAGYGMASSGTITPSKQPVSSVNRTTRSPGSVAATSVAGALDGVLRLKLRLMAALGELAFYVSAQDSAPTDIGRVAPAWNFPADVWNILVGAVNSPTVVISGGGATRSGGRSADEIAEITKHYATKVYFTYISPPAIA